MVSASLFTFNTIHPFCYLFPYYFHLALSVIHFDLSINLSDNSVRHSSHNAKCTYNPGELISTNTSRLFFWHCGHSFTQSRKPSLSLSIIFILHFLPVALFLSVENRAVFWFPCYVWKRQITITYKFFLIILTIITIIIFHIFTYDSTTILYFATSPLQYIDNTKYTHYGD